MHPGLLAALPLLAGLAACEHAQPFGAADLGPNVPFSTEIPRQLTFNAGPDRDPAWLPDGSGMIYAFGLDRADHDQCLGILPPDGGHRLQSICHVPAHADADSTNVLSNPAAGPGGQVAYLRENSLVGALAPTTRELVVAALSRPDPGRVVLVLPQLAPDGQRVNRLSHLHWLAAGSLVFLAEQVTYAQTPTDTVETPIEVMRLDFTDTSSTLSVVPNTLGATSVAVSTRATLYVTMQGDSVVYEVEPASGQSAPLFDFGSLGAASDAQVAGTRLVAVAGALTATLRLGLLVSVDLTSGTVSPVSSTSTTVFYRVPALDPSGSRVVAESRDVTFFKPSEFSPVIDTIVGTASDLWLFQ